MEYKEKVIFANLFVFISYVLINTLLFYSFRHNSLYHISNLLKALFMLIFVLIYLLPLFIFLFGLFYLRKKILKKAKNKMKPDIYLNFALEIYKTPSLLSTLKDKHMLENEALKQLNLEEFNKYDQELDRKRKRSIFSIILSIFFLVYLLNGDILITLCNRSKYMSFINIYYLFSIIFICFVLLIYLIIVSFKLIYFDNKLNLYV
jgi:hypothetical protein